mmetsp:Transcript_125286/g.350816  ORF Transcript_125286/g.350816 Transcript_125286/m.350816 type:complete len:630 (+) Transcript_125286:65-1954(+)
MSSAVVVDDVESLLGGFRRIVQEEFGHMRTDLLDQVRALVPGSPSVPHVAKGVAPSGPKVAVLPVQPVADRRQQSHPSCPGDNMQDQPSLPESTKTVKILEDEVVAQESTPSLGHSHGSLQHTTHSVKAFLPVRSYRFREALRDITCLDEATDQHLPRFRSTRGLHHSAKVHPCSSEQLEDTLKRAANATADAPREAGTAMDGSQASMDANPSTFMSRKEMMHGRVSSVQTALGLSPKHMDTGFDREISDVSRSTLRRRLAVIVRSSRFDALSLCVVMFSAALIGAQTDHMARHREAEPPVIYRTLDVILLVYFIMESSVRLYVYRRRFFSMWGWGWNVFDLLLIGFQVTEAILSGSNLSSTTLLRLARMLRTVRVLRAIHVMRIAQELRLLVSCILHSAHTFWWSMILIMTMIYVFAVHFSQIALAQRIEDGLPASSEGPGRLSKWYGNVPRSALSLFQGLTGGVDWNDLVEPLVEYVSPWMGTVFFLYTSFAMLCVMNVVMATFVQNATERAAEVHEAHKVFQAGRLFETLDSDSKGTITLDEIERNLQSPAVQDFFKSIDVDVKEARILFDMLDADDSGEIEFSEFISGCMRLQGPSKAIDLVLVMREIREALAVLKPGAQKGELA